MKNLTKQTNPVKSVEIKREWHLIDAKGAVLGRLVPKISRYLQGKNKTNYVSYLDSGDYVVVINAKKIVITGRKSLTKKYTSYSGYPGGLKKVSYLTLLDKNPALIIKYAVSGMLPKNKFRDNRLNRLFIFADEKHPYNNQLKS